MQYKPMTDDELIDMSKICDKVTFGPWEARMTQGAGWSVRTQNERPGYTGHSPICSMAWWQFDIPGIIDDEISAANAQFIALAREAIPRLLATIERDRND